MLRSLLNLIFPALVVCALSLTSCGDKSNDLQRTDTSTLVEVVTGDEPKNIDPHITDDGGDTKLILQVYETLVRVDPTDFSKLVPALAESWTIAEDKLSIAFTIRSGVKFHDGSDLDALTCKRSIDRVRTEPLAQYKKLYSSIAATEAEGMKFTVKLDSPVPSIMLRNLSVFAASIVSPKLMDGLEKGGEAATSIRTNPAGTGPFKLDRFQPGQPQRLVANESYWNGAPSIKTLVFRQVKESLGRLQEFTSGKAAVVDDVPRAEWDKLGQNLKRWNALNTAYMGLNCVHPLTSDVRVRRAIQLAVDRAELLPLWHGCAVANWSLLPPAFGHHDASFKPEKSELPLAERQKLAGELVKEAGAVGRELTIYYPQDSRPYLPDPQKIANKISQQLSHESVGMKVKIQAMENTVLFQNFKNNEWEICLLGWMNDNGDPDNFYYPLMGGEMKDGKSFPFDQNNGRGWDQQCMSWILEAQQATSEDVRKRLYRQIEKRMASTVVGHLPLVSTQQAMAISPKLTGVEIDGLGHYRFHKAKLN